MATTQQSHDDSRPAQRRRVRNWAIVCAAALISGCAAPDIVSRAPTSFWEIDADAEDNRLGVSKRTMRWLEQREIDIDEQTDQQITDELHQHWRHVHDLDTAYAIAEIAHRQAIAGEDRNDDSQQLQLNATALKFAYGFLFSPEFAKKRNTFDPRFRGAGAIYNQALASTLRILQKRDALAQPRAVATQCAGEPFQIAVAPTTAFDWRSIERLQLAETTRGKLRYKRQTFGLGAPMIAIPRSATSQPSDDPLAKYLYRIPQAVTAFARIERAADGSGDRAIIELLSPAAGAQVAVADQTVRLRSDVSAPLVYLHDDAQMNAIRTAGLFDPESARQFAGLYMLEPFDPDKIPLIMIHGLISDPLTWTGAYDELSADPDIRKNFQFWFYFYPTGQPFHESAADLRAKLTQLRHEVPIDRRRPTMLETVMIGHSMGGLIARMVTVDSGNRFRNALFTTPIESVVDDPLTTSKLLPVYQFEHDPFVSRIVTVGTPHHGSEYAFYLTRMLGRMWVQPSERTRLLSDIETENPGFLRDKYAAQTSIDTLARSSPVLAALDEAAPVRAKFHNIYGVGQNEVLHDRVGEWLGVPIQANLIQFSLTTSDGVVSADSADSDQAHHTAPPVPARHEDIHSDPRTIEYMRAVLYEVIHEYRARNRQHIANSHRLN